MKMKHADILEMEYREQYNQYRWIGQMQVAVLTFYGIVSTFATLAVAAFRPEDPTTVYYRWPAGVMIVLGIFGMFIGWGLFRSRIMQLRTARYLAILLVQMAGAAQDIVSVSGSALPFRTLCSTRGRFRLWDTMNIVILLAFFLGEGFLLAGAFAWLVIENILCLNQAAVIGSICWSVSMVIVYLIQGPLMGREIANIDAQQEKIKNKNIQTLHQMQKHFEEKDTK
jgi:hypothetical protein